MAGVPPYPRMRDTITSDLGPELVIVSLVMEEEDARERLSSRHHGDGPIVQTLMARYIRFMIVWQTNSPSKIRNITEPFLEEEGMTRDEILQKSLK